MSLRSRLSLAVLVLGLLVLPGAGAQACGGFFCTTAPINQQVERIIFAQKGQEISAFVQINYTGEVADFAWVVPVPTVPKVDVATMEMFQELDTLTAPVYIGPQMPEECMVVFSAAVEDGAGGSGVTVFSSGEVGPFAYDVIGSEDPRAMVNWLRDNGYQILEAMEPLIDVYVREKMLFLAMKLRPGQGVQDIQPVKMTYTSRKPMIPLRLTAVAANPNMGVLVWLLGDTPYQPENYAAVEIKDEEIEFFQFGFHNYFQLRSQKIDAVQGQGFVTEFIGRTSELTPLDNDLAMLFKQYPYLTRAYAELSPEEMTLDPVFAPNAALPDRSNVHDLSEKLEWREDCTTGPVNTISVDIPDPVQTALPGVGSQASAPTLWVYVALGGVVVLALMAAAFVAGRRLK